MAIFNLDISDWISNVDWVLIAWINSSFGFIVWDDFSWVSTFLPLAWDFLLSSVWVSWFLLSLIIFSGTVWVAVDALSDLEFSANYLGFDDFESVGFFFVSVTVAELVAFGVLPFGRL